MYTDFTHSFTVTHESRNLKQARPKGQYVDLLLYESLLLPHNFYIIHHLSEFVNRFVQKNIVFSDKIRLHIILIKPLQNSYTQAWNEFISSYYKEKIN